MDVEISPTTPNLSAILADPNGLGSVLESCKPQAPLQPAFSVTHDIPTLAERILEEEKTKKIATRRIQRRQDE
jgi:hypothetical protein